MNEITQGGLIRLQLMGSAKTLVDGQISIIGTIALRANGEIQVDPVAIPIEGVLDMSFEQDLGEGTRPLFIEYRGPIYDQKIHFGIVHLNGHTGRAVLAAMPTRLDRSSLVFRP